MILHAIHSMVTASSDLAQFLNSFEEQLLAQATRTVAVDVPPAIVVQSYIYQTMAIVSSFSSKCLGWDLNFDIPPIVPVEFYTSFDIPPITFFTFFTFFDQDLYNELRREFQAELRSKVCHILWVIGYTVFALYIVFAAFPRLMRSLLNFVGFLSFFAMISIVYTPFVVCALSRASVHPLIVEVIEELMYSIDLFSWHGIILGLPVATSTIINICVYLSSTRASSLKPKEHSEPSVSVTSMASEDIGSEYDEETFVDANANNPVDDQVIYSESNLKSNFDEDSPTTINMLSFQATDYRIRALVESQNEVHKLLLDVYEMAFRSKSDTVVQTDDLLKDICSLSDDVSTDATCVTTNTVAIQCELLVSATASFDVALDCPVDLAEDLSPTSVQDECGNETPIRTTILATTVPDHNLNDSACNEDLSMYPTEDSTDCEILVSVNTYDNAVLEVAVTKDFPPTSEQDEFGNDAPIKTSALTGTLSEYVSVLTSDQKEFRNRTPIQTTVLAMTLPDYDFDSSTDYKNPSMSPAEEVSAKCEILLSASTSNDVALDCPVESTTEDVSPASEQEVCGIEAPTETVILAMTMPDLNFDGSAYHEELSTYSAGEDSIDCGVSESTATLDDVVLDCPVQLMEDVSLISEKEVCGNETLIETVTLATNVSEPEFDHEESSTYVAEDNSTDSNRESTLYVSTCDTISDVSGGILGSIISSDIDDRDAIDEKILGDENEFENNSDSDGSEMEEVLIEPMKQDIGFQSELHPPVVAWSGRDFWISLPTVLEVTEGGTMNVERTEEEMDTVLSKEDDGLTENSNIGEDIVKASEEYKSQRLLLEIDSSMDNADNHIPKAPIERAAMEWEVSVSDVFEWVPEIAEASVRLPEVNADNGISTVSFHPTPAFQAHVVEPNKPEIYIPEILPIVVDAPSSAIDIGLEDNTQEYISHTDAKSVVEVERPHDCIVSDDNQFVEMNAPEVDQQNSLINPSHAPSAPLNDLTVTFEITPSDQTPSVITNILSWADAVELEESIQEVSTQIDALSVAMESDDSSPQAESLCQRGQENIYGDNSGEDDREGNYLDDAFKESEQSNWNALPFATKRYAKRSRKGSRKGRGRGRVNGTLKSTNNETPSDAHVQVVTEEGESDHRNDGQAEHVHDESAFQDSSESITASEQIPPPESIPPPPESIPALEPENEDTISLSDFDKWDQETRPKQSAKRSRFGMRTMDEIPKRFEKNVVRTPGGRLWVDPPTSGSSSPSRNFSRPSERKRKADVSSGDSPSLPRKNSSPTDASTSHSSLEPQGSNDELSDRAQGKKRQRQS